MKLINILTASVSENHLTAALRLKLLELGYIVTPIILPVNSIVGAYIITEATLHKAESDLIIAVGDRTEQLGGVLAAYQYNIPVCHLYAGDINKYISTHDDIHRHSITLYSDIQLCSSEEACNQVYEIFDSIMVSGNTDYIGATHFDLYKENGTYKKILDTYIYNTKDIKYNLILINSETKGNNNILLKEFEDKILLSQIKDCILVQSNEDSALEVQIERILRLNDFKLIAPVLRYKHPDFISLLSKCSYFITNSSSAIYEAPEFLHPNQIVIIGKRNKNRTLVPHEAHDGLASYRAAKYIHAYLENKL